MHFILSIFNSNKSHLFYKLHSDSSTEIIHRISKGGDFRLLSTVKFMSSIKTLWLIYFFNHWRLLNTYFVFAFTGISVMGIMHSISENRRSPFKMSILLSTLPKPFRPSLRYMIVQHSMGIHIFHNPILYIWHG